MLQSAIKKSEGYDSITAMIAEVKSELNLHRWMLGTSIALNIAILLKLFA